MRYNQWSFILPCPTFLLRKKCSTWTGARWLSARALAWYAQGPRFHPFQYHNNNSNKFLVSHLVLFLCVYKPVCTLTWETRWVFLYHFLHFFFVILMATCLHYQYECRTFSLAGAEWNAYALCDGEATSISCWSGVWNWAPTLFFLLSQILVYSLEAERCLSKLGNALGDFTCINLRDSPPSLMVSGNMDRRYVWVKKAVLGGTALLWMLGLPASRVLTGLCCLHSPLLTLELYPPEFSSCCSPDLENRALR